MNILNYILQVYSKQKNTKFIQKSINYIISIVDYYCGVKSYAEAAYRIKK